MIKIESVEHFKTYLNSMKDMSIDWNKIVIKWDGWEYRANGGSLINQESGNNQTWEVVWHNEQVNINKSIRAELKVRYIKTKDKLILKSVNEVGTY